MDQVAKGDTLVPKLCGMAIFTLSSLFMGLLPQFLERCFHNRSSNHRLGYNSVFGQLSAFGGGVLLSTTFLHLLPEIRENIEDLQRKNVIPYRDSLPLAELLMCLGFLFLFIVESVAHKYIMPRGEVEIKPSGEECVVEFVNRVYPSASENGASSNKGEFSGEAAIVGLERATDGDADKEPERTKIASGMNGHDYGSGITSRHRHYQHQHQHQHDDLHAHDHSQLLFTEASGKNFLLIFALSIHECFEGLAIGLETQRDAVWYMLLGVGTHKVIIAFCVGVQMLSMKKQQVVAVLYIVVFASTTSLGVAVGLFLSTESGMVAVILQGLATGTLLYVVFFELLKPHSHKSPCLGVVVGFFLMALLKYFVPS